QAINVRIFAATWRIMLLHIYCLAQTSRIYFAVALKRAKADHQQVLPPVERPTPQAVLYFGISRLK
ncbi:MAG: hypothetical protein RR260_06700, partial [Clostridia bacterium]